MSVERRVTLGLGIVFLVLAFFSMLAWIDNLSVARQWHSGVIERARKSAAREAEKEANKDRKLTEKEQKEADQKAAEEKKAAEKEEIYSGPISFLDWTCVDMTTVSTFAPFFGFLLIGVGFFRILNLDGASALSENFPFFEDYDRIMVILGLAGTLWGIIMIGYYPPQEVSMPKLMQCLHTSLYSTLVVILWIFLISRPMSGAMQWWYGNIASERTGGDVDVTALFNELGVSVSGVAKDFKVAGQEAVELKKQTEAVKKEFEKTADFLAKFKEQTGVDVFGAVKKSLEGLDNSSQKICETLTEMKAESLASKKLIEEQGKLIVQQQEFLKKLDEKLSAEMLLRQTAEQKALVAEKEKTKAITCVEQVKTLLKNLS